MEAVRRRRKNQPRPTFNRERRHDYGSLDDISWTIASESVCCRPIPAHRSISTRSNVLEEAGIAAIVLPTLFEEQLQSEQMALFDSIDTPAESFPEALSYFVEPEQAIVEPEAHMSTSCRSEKAHQRAGYRIDQCRHPGQVDGLRQADGGGGRRRAGTGFLLCGQRRFRVG